jgi:hypothetical protein
MMGLQYPFAGKTNARIYVLAAVIMKIIVFRDVYSSTLKTEAADYTVSHLRRQQSSRQQMLQPIPEIGT